MAHSDFDFIEGENGGQFVLVDGPLVQLRGLLARGEVDAAVAVYEDTGAIVRDQLLVEAETASLETRKSIAELLRRSRDFAAAARVFRFARLDREAGAAFEQAGEFAEAASCWARASEPLKAAAALERAGKIDAALELYRKAGANDRAAECLARGQRFVEASQEFRKLGNSHAEFEVLKAGIAAQPGSLALVSRMAEIMLQHGRKEQAAQLLMETARRAPDAKDDARFLTLLAAGLDSIGNTAGAEKVRARVQELPRDAMPLVQGVAEVAQEPAADAYGFLKALPMFADLALDDMKALYRVCRMHQFQAGQHVIEPGQPGKGLFLIVEGQVEVYAGAAPGAKLLNTLGVGAYVGEISLVQDGPTSARVTSRGPVKVLFISRDAFHQYVYAAPSAALRIYQLFTHNLAERVRVLSAQA